MVAPPPTPLRVFRQSRRLIALAGAVCVLGFVGGIWILVTQAQGRDEVIISWLLILGFGLPTLMAAKQFIWPCELRLYPDRLEADLVLARRSWTWPEIEEVFLFRQSLVTFIRVRAKGKVHNLASFWETPVREIAHAIVDGPRAGAA